MDEDVFAEHCWSRIHRSLLSAPCPRRDFQRLHLYFTPSWLGPSQELGVEMELFQTRVFSQSPLNLQHPTKHVK